MKRLMPGCYAYAAFHGLVALGLRVADEAARIAELPLFAARPAAIEREEADRHLLKLDGRVAARSSRRPGFTEYSRRSRAQKVRELVSWLRNSMQRCVPCALLTAGFDAPFQVVVDRF